MCKLGSIGIHTDTESVSGFSEDGPGEARKQTVMMGPLGGPQNTGESRAFCRLLGVLGKLGAIKLLSQFLGRDGILEFYKNPSIWGRKVDLNYASKSIVRGGLTGSEELGR